MQSKAHSPDQYMAELPDDRKIPMAKLRKTILDNLPESLEEVMSYGMLGYVIPHSIYPNGYHCDPKLPLGFLAIASQKNFIAFYSMIIYGDKTINDWFVSEYPKQCKTKLDMGKCCIRFKKMDDIPYDLIAALVQKVSVQEWITMYESTLNSKKQ
jgi:uncharacterized protein YdhG (YjbR/CyaY superfamily)